MVATVTAIVDTGFLVGLLSRRDSYHDWAVAHAAEYAPPWHTCEAVLTETMFVVGAEGSSQVGNLLRRDVLSLAFNLGREYEPVLALMAKYRTVPMSLADACLVRMSELIAMPMIITTDADFHVYRRHSRQAIPCVVPK